MNDLEFGQQVRLTHIVQRHYVDVHTERVERRPATAGAGLRLNAVHDDGPLQFRPHWGDEPGEDGIPGLPLPDPSPLPGHKGTFRLLRRHEREAHGIVVGRTWRVEGQRHEGTPYSAWDGDWEPAHFDPFRRVEVVQVALDPGEVGARPWPATVVLAVAEDVEPA